MVNFTSGWTHPHGTRSPGRWLRCLALLLALPACAQATPALTVVSYNVLFGTTAYNLTGSARTTLPWDIAGIGVAFSLPILTGNLNSLSSTPALPLSTLFGLHTNTLVWELSAPIANGAYSTTLAGSGPNALSTGANALTDGLGYSQSFDVLFGDVNGDGKVDGADLAAVIAAESQPYNIFADLNGDGVVNSADAALVPPAIAVPEPASLALLGLGLVAASLARRKGKIPS